MKIYQKKMTIQLPKNLRILKKMIRFLFGQAEYGIGLTQKIWLEL